MAWRAVDSRSAASGASTLPGRLGTRRAKRLVVGGVLALALAAAGTARTAPVAIWMEISSDPGPATEPAPTAGATLLVNGLAARERHDLSRGLAKLVQGLERRKNPLYTPLDDSDMHDEVVSLLARTRPARTAATALAAGRWRTADGDLSARAVTRCAPAVRCRSLTAGDTGDGLARRLRFLVWPLGFALLAVGRDAADAAAIADRLRAGEAVDSRIALVLTAAELHRRRPDRETAAIVHTATRVAKLATAAPPELMELLHGIAHPPGGDELAWLRLPPGAVLVVPRLGALATRDALLTEVRGRLSGHPATIGWLASETAPTP